MDTGLAKLAEWVRSSLLPLAAALPHCRIASLRDTRSHGLTHMELLPRSEMLSAPVRSTSRASTKNALLVAAQATAVISGVANATPRYQVCLDSVHNNAVIPCLGV